MGALQVLQRGVDALWRLRAGQVQANTLTTSRQLEQVLLSREGFTAARVAVTPQTALMVAAVSAAVGLLSESTAQLPVHVYRRVGGNKERVDDHAVARLLGSRPNGWQDAFQFRELMTSWLCLWGNAYAFKNRLGDGRLYELLPIHPDRVQPQQADDYRVTYQVVLASGEQVTLPRDAVFHLRDRSLDGLKGLSRLRSGRDSIGLALVAERWGAQLFGNGGRPSGVLSTDQKLNGEQITQIAESWKAAHGGENALGTAVLDGGFKWEPLTMNNNDAQFLETRKFQIAEISRLYRVPPHMLGDLERATFSNIEHQSLDFVRFSLLPWLRRWEFAINTQLVDQREGVFAEYLVEGLLRGDTKTRYEAYQIGIQNGWLSPNEVRGFENLNPRDGGDEFKPASNLYGNPSDGGRREPAQTA